MPEDTKNVFAFKLFPKIIQEDDPQLEDDFDLSNAPNKDICTEEIPTDDIIKSLGHKTFEKIIKGAPYGFEELEQFGARWGERYDYFDKKFGKEALLKHFTEFIGESEFKTLLNYLSCKFDKHILQKISKGQYIDMVQLFKTITDELMQKLRQTFHDEF